MFMVKFIIPVLLNPLLAFNIIIETPGLTAQGWTHFIGNIDPLVHPLPSTRSPPSHGIAGE